MAIQGVFASDSHIVGNRRGDFASGLLQVYPQGNAQLLALSSGMDSADARDTIVNWFEEDHNPGRLDITGFSTDGNGTGVIVADASSIVPGTVLLVEQTGEYVLVTASNVSTNTITVTRAIDGAAPVLMTTAMFMQRIGTAFEEGSAKPVAVVNLGRVRSNYTQIFRNTWSLTGTATAVEFYTGSAVAKNKADASLMHSEDIERSLWWGKKAVGTLNNKPFRVMDGLYAQITTNVTAAGGTTSYAQLDAFFMGIFSKNIKGKPNERIVFTGNKGLAVLNQIALNNAQMTITPETTTFGLSVTKWKTPYGNVSLMTHPLFTESPFFTGDLVVIHPGGFRMRWLRRTFWDNYDENGRRAGDDADYGVITSELTCEYRAEVTGGRLTGLTAAAA